MPSPDPLSPSDLRPGQRVRITESARDGEWSVTREGVVLGTSHLAVRLGGIGFVTVVCPPWNDVYTQTIEVIQ